VGGNTRKKRKKIGSDWDGIFVVKEDSSSLSNFAFQNTGTVLKCVRSVGAIVYDLVNIKQKKNNNNKELSMPFSVDFDSFRSS